MSLSFKYTITLLSFITLFSCTDEVDLDIPQTKTRLIIDGVLTDSVGESNVKIFQSVDFSSSNEFPAIVNAKVWVEDENRDTINFYYNDKDEKYLPVNKLFVGEYGKKYTLKIENGNDRYSSSVQDLKKVPDFFQFDAYEEGENPYFPKTPYDDILFFFSLIDKEVNGDHYRWQIYLNDVYLASGGEVRINRDKELRSPTDSILDQRPFEVKPGDVVSIRQSWINEDVFDFWEAYSVSGSSQGGPFDTPPKPPKSNIINDNNPDEEIFGIFSVESAVYKTTVIE